MEPNITCLADDCPRKALPSNQRGTDSGYQVIDVPRLLTALRELSKAFVDGRQDRYGMRIPAEPYRDGDIVCGTAARLIERLTAPETGCARCKEHEMFRHQHRDCDRLAIALHQIKLGPSITLANDEVAAWAASIAGEALHQKTSAPIPDSGGASS